MAIDMALVFHAVEAVLTFFLIGCVGYFLARKNWFTPESNFLFSKLITLVALPPYLLYNINTIMTKKELLSLAYGLVVPFASVATSLIMAMALSRLMKVPKTREGIFRSSLAFSNTVYIGLPVNLALFGEKALPYVLLYYFGNTFFFWTFGNYFLASDSVQQEGGLSIFSLATMKKLLSPPMFGFIAGLLLLALDVKLPTFLANTCRYLGNLTTPMVILSVGVTLQGLGLSKIRFNWELAVIIFGRFVAAPLVVVAVTWFFPIPELMRQVFIIQASLPVMSSVAMMANFYRSDVEYATVSVSATTILGLFTIPVFMVLVTYYL